MTVYGPYTRKDGRQHVIHYDGVTKRTQSYPRYLMEQYLERPLRDDEQVDHINNDYTDNRIENLQLLTQLENINKSSKRAETKQFNCPVCKIEFTKTLRRWKDNQIKQKKAGPYCSRSCAGKAHN